MSFADKISSLMARPGQDVVPKDDVPWWMRYGGRAVGTIGGFIAIFLGVFMCLDIIKADLSCLIGGIWQILIGFVTICVEAPCCCMFVDYVQNLSDHIEKRPYWNRAVAYVGLAIPGIVLCPSLSAIFGSGLILLTGVIYGMMALGKKASAEEMRQSAVAETNTAPTTTTPNTKPNSMRSNLVENAQPISFTGAPMYDSNV